MATRKTKKAAKPAAKNLTRNGNPARVKKQSNPALLETTAGVIRYYVELGVEHRKGKFVSIDTPSFEVVQEAAVLIDEGKFDEVERIIEKLPLGCMVGINKHEYRALVGDCIRLVRNSAKYIYDESHVLGFHGFVGRPKTDD